MGRDHTLFALVEGHVKFTKVPRRFIKPQSDRKWKKRPFRRFVNIIPTPYEPCLVLKKMNEVPL